MNRFILAATLVSCLFALATEASKLREREGHRYEERPRLGHFKNKPFTDLYKTYAAAFVLPNFKDRVADDYRNYLPSGDECMVFFRKFRIDEYNLRDLDDFIVLDACLGYLLESAYHEQDSAASKQVRDELPGLIADEKLTGIYQNTNIDQFSEPAKLCFGNMLLAIVQVKTQFADTSCNNHWLHIFNTFAECQKQHVPAEVRSEDSYGKILYDLVKSRANECFNAEIHKINEAIRGKYTNNPFTHVVNNVSWNPIKRQSKERLWPSEIANLLAATQGTTQEINSREISNIIKGIHDNDSKFRVKLLKNMADYADKKIKPKLNSKSTKQDPDGEQRYFDLVDHMCKFFRQTDSKDYYDYATPLVRMVRMLQYPDVFDISESYFVKNMILHSYESRPLYLSVSLCNMLSFTYAQFIARAPNGPLHYKVAFRPDLSEMVNWPDAGFY